MVKICPGCNSNLYQDVCECAFIRAKHIINEKAFQEAYKVAVNESQALVSTLLLHLSDDDFDKMKRHVYKAFLETYLEVVNND